MSLTTRCPACATQFKVVPDQLKLSDGWVRCGHCSDVFDASRYLEAWVPGATETRLSGADRAMPNSSRELPATPSLSAIQASVMGQGVSGNQADEDVAAAPGPEAAYITLHADALDRELTPVGPGLPPSPDQADFNEAGGSSTILPVDQEAIQRGDREAADAMQQIAEDVAQLPAHARAGTGTGTGTGTRTRAQEPGFVRQARRRAFWRSPSVRLLLSVVMLLLWALLASQWAVQERDRLAARYPDFQPLLARLCEPLGCTIGAVRDLQAVVIDSSTLTRRLGDFYSFDLVLKNTSAMALAMPALELSLTDTADTVISRRVYLPGELPDVPPLLPPRSTVPVSLRLSLAVGNELSMAGYRALVFYP
jgi:predicted Zn finger-like uncharacterized protein